MTQNDIPLPYLKISPFLDMLGVRLSDKFVTTRSFNGEDIIEIVKSKINAWKSGKFVPFTSRPWSINHFALSKIWFRTSSIDLRAGDCNKIVSICKSWMYQDRLLKPQEEILFRSIPEGGLGMFNISCKARANLVTSFVQTAVGVSFKTNGYHKALFDYHVNGVGVKEPPRPPYYNLNFFTYLQNAVKEGNDINNWKSKDWYLRILKSEVTYVPDEISGEPVLKLVRNEFLYPQINHLNSVSFIRQKFLPSRLRSQLFLMKHDLLPTKERLYNCHKAESVRCILCNSVDGHGHFLFCSETISVTQPTLSAIRSLAHCPSNEQIINCDFDTNQDSAFVISWLLGTLSIYLWECRYKETSSQSETIPSPQLPLMEITIQTRTS